jgi:Mg2+ and Co2+ transporter CorA
VAKKPATKKPVVVEDELDREEKALKGKEEKDEEETKQLEQDLLKEERVLSDDRRKEQAEVSELANDLRDPKHRDMKKVAAARAALEKEKREMALEEQKLRVERDKLLAVERDDALSRTEEYNLEHPNADLACFRKCLNEVHNALACKRRCAAKVKKAIKAQANGVHLTTHTAMPTHSPEKPCLGTCYGALPKGTCCNTCEDVQAAYLHRNWALPALSKIAQCKGKKAVAKNSHVVKGAHKAIFKKGNASKKQQETNKMIHKLLFSHLKRLTDTKPHFIAKKEKKVRVINPNILKWQEYRLKRLAASHPVVGQFGAKGSKSAAPQRLMLKMSSGNMRKWANLKVHHWVQPSKAKIVRRLGVHAFVKQKHALQKKVATKIKSAHLTVSKKVTKGAKGTVHQPVN